MKKEKIIANILPTIVYIALFLVITVLIGLSSVNSQTTAILFLMAFDIMLLFAVALECHRNKNISILFTIVFSILIFFIGDFFGMYVGRIPDKTADYYSYKGTLVGLILVSFYLLTLIITSMLLSNKKDNLAD